MKPKLPCCEINKKSEQLQNKVLECDCCECFFDNKTQLDDHNREIHGISVSGKQRLPCCVRNGAKKKKNEIHDHLCHYCDCSFLKKNQLENHCKSVHECSNCGQLVLSKDMRALHKIKHENEQREREERKKKQEDNDKDLFFNYVKTNKLDEYVPEPGYEPDYYLIFHNYRFENEELLKFVNKFDVNPLDYYEEYMFFANQIIYLLENNGLCVGDVAQFLDGLTYSVFDDNIMPELIAYFMEKDYGIRPKWVARSIENDALMERIKLKYTSTFDEIFGARDEFSRDGKRDEFYVQVHKHFPNPNFKDPFADPFIEFVHVSTTHVHDHLHNRYFYDEENDELSIVIHRGGEDEDISLGHCKEMYQADLHDLISRYNAATKEYDEVNEKVSDLFQEREEELDRCTTYNQRLGVLDDYYHLIHCDALQDRNYLANDVSKLYFVISKK